jgi:hypothetical protein
LGSSDALTPLEQLLEPVAVVAAARGLLDVRWGFAALCAPVVAVYVALRVTVVGKAARLVHVYLVFGFN